MKSTYGVSEGVLCREVISIGPLFRVSFDRGSTVSGEFVFCYMSILVGPSSMFFGGVLGCSEANH